MMRFVIKILVSLCIILFCTQVGRKMPSLAGLITVMPITGLIVMTWFHLDNPDNFKILTDYTKGTIWGIVPSIIFFIIAFLCFKRHIPVTITVAAGLTVWVIAAIVHQWFPGR